MHGTDRPLPRRGGVGHRGRRRRRSRSHRRGDGGRRSRRTGAHLQAQAVQRDAGHTHPALQRQGVHAIDLQRLPACIRLPEGGQLWHAHTQLAERQATGDAQHRHGRRGALLELHGQRGVQAALTGRDLHARWQEGLGRRQPVRHVHRLPRQLHLGTVPLFEGQGLALDLQGAAVHPRLQQRLHRDIDVTGQVGDERHPQLQLFHPVFLFQHPVGVAQHAVTDLDVEDRKAGGLGVGLRLGRRRHQTGHHRADVELIGRLAFEPEHRLGQLHTADDRRKVSHRGQRELGLRLLEREPGRRRWPHGHAVHFDGQRPRLDAHSRHLDRGPERFGGRGLDAGLGPVRQPQTDHPGPHRSHRGHARQGFDPGALAGNRCDRRGGVRTGHRARLTRSQR